MDHTTNIAPEISKSKIICALRRADHDVECPVTGRVRLNGVDVTDALEATQHAPGSDDEWTLANTCEYLLDASNKHHDYTVAATEGGIYQELWTGSCTLKAAQAELAKIGAGLSYGDYVDVDYVDEIPVMTEILVLSDGADYAEILEVEMQA